MNAEERRPEPTLPLAAVTPTSGGGLALEPQPGAPGDTGGGRPPTRGRKPHRTRRVVLEWVVVIAVALAVAFVIKTFLFQAFYIPSESMVPTLQVGDRVLVNKVSYHVHDVHRGDIVVFEAPAVARTGNIKDLVKRVIGLPDETVTAEGGRVYVDGRQLQEPYLPDGVLTTFSGVPPGCGKPADGSEGCRVPAGHLLVMGDNRQASKDGRVFGPIEESTIVGRVFLRVWPPGSIGRL